VVSFPEQLGGGRVPFLQGRDPVRHRASGRHGGPPGNDGLGKK
jgi:hypothetical protein